MTIKKFVKRSLKIIKKAMNHILLTASLFLSIYSIFKILLSVLWFVFLSSIAYKGKGIIWFNKTSSRSNSHYPN